MRIVRLHVAKTTPPPAANGLLKDLWPDRRAAAVRRRYAARVKGRLGVAAIVALSIPLLVSQLLPSDNPDRWSPIALSLLAAIGALAGFMWPTARGWVSLMVWTVLGSAMVLLSWTDLILDVSPSVLPPDTWRNEASVAIASALAIVSGGFIVGMLVARRARPQMPPRTLTLVGATVVGALLASTLVAVVFAGSSIVVQPGDGVVTVLVSDTKIDISPAALSGRSYHVVFESRASRTFVVSGVVPIGIDDGGLRAMTAAEIEAWRAGTWEVLGPPFRDAVRSQSLVPGGRAFGGFLQVRPSPDGSGGVLWFMSEEGAARVWPSEAGEEKPGELPYLIPWPITDSVVQPVSGN